MRTARSTSRTRRQRIEFAHGQYCPRSTWQAGGLTNVRVLSIVRLMSDIAPISLREPLGDGYELGYDLDETIVADSPVRLKAVGHPLRSLILDLVLERAMTVTELAERVRKPRSEERRVGKECRSRWS